MCQITTTWVTRGLLAALLIPVFSLAQQSAPVRGANRDWRQIGTAAVGLALPSPATGPVDRVWYGDGGERLYLRTESGRVFNTEDFDTWVLLPGGAVTPPERLPAVGVAPESGARLIANAPGAPARYAVGSAVYRSDDGGLNWLNLTEYRRQSILGGGLRDLAVSPQNEDEIVVAGRFGVWRSLDAGASWSGLNDSLPNLPVRRLLGLPGDGRGVRVLVEGAGELEWAPGERNTWKPVMESALAEEDRLRSDVSSALGVPVGPVATAGDYIYASAERPPTLWASADGGRTWRDFTVEAGAVRRFHVDPENPALALAVLGERPGAARPVHVLRTTNGGIFWDDLTSNLPDVAANGITADTATGSVYVATNAGVFFTQTDLAGAGPASGWSLLPISLDSPVVHDVMLDDAGNQLYIGVDGDGVFAMAAPHRRLAPSVVNAADLRERPVAPGVLLSVLGGNVRAATADGVTVPVLAATGRESQLQLPFEVEGGEVSLDLTAASGAGEPRQYSFALPLKKAAPAIFVDREGTPMVLDADSGVLLDPMNPARSGARLHILATGLGRVSPAWPTGMPAPMEDPPSVVSPVRVFVDRIPLQATRAVLAPGYVGFYLIEVELPKILNFGPAELYIEADGETSNRTRLFLEP